MIQFDLNLNALDLVAKNISRLLKTGNVFAFNGALGAGKSTIIRAIIQALTTPQTNVPSPTFTLMQCYESNVAPIWHFDFYRLQDPDEALELGIDEAFNNGISFIEWPEKIGHHLPQKRVEFNIEILNEVTRRIFITPYGDINDQLIEYLRSL